MGAKPILAQMPITTGQFGDDDMHFSLAYKIADILNPQTETGKRLNTFVYEGLKMGDWVAWAMLRVWNKEMSVEQMVKLASGYFVHPEYDKNRKTKELIDDWTKAKPTKVREATDKNAALHRSQHHNHDALYGTEDVLKRD